MHYSILFASLAALATAAPMGMKSTNSMDSVKQALDTSYGLYAKYLSYGDYPKQVEDAAGTMAKSNMKRDTTTTNEANEMNKRQAADISYGSYGAYGRYSDYGEYSGEVQDEAAKMAKAKMDAGMTQ